MLSESIRKLEKKLSALNRKEETADLADLLNELARELSVIDLPRSLKLAEESLAMSTRLSYAIGRAWALSTIGFGNYMSALYEEAIQASLEAVGIFDQLGHVGGKARALSVLAGSELSMGNYEAALAKAMEAREMLRGAGDRQMEGWILNGIGTGFQELGDYERAIEYHRESLDLFEEEEGKLGVARAYTGLGYSHQALGRFDEAIDVLNKSLVLFEELDNQLGKSRALNDLGIVYHKQGDLQRALKLHEEALEIRDSIGARQPISTSLIALGNVYNDMNMPDKALDVLGRAEKIATEIKAKPRIFQTNLALSNAYALEGDQAKALEHYKVYQDFKEQVAGDQANARITNLRITFETENAQRENEINRLRNEELKDKNDQLEKVVWDLKAAQAKLIQSEKMASLGSLVAGLVHEINTPLGVIRSGTDVVTRCIVNIVDVLETSGSIEEARSSNRLRRAMNTLKEDNRTVMEATERIAGMSQSLRSFARLDEAPFQKVDIHDGIESALNLLGYEFEERIAIDKQFGEVPDVACYPGELNQVFMNLLTNASQAISGAGTVTIKTFVEDKKVNVKISDTGVGISRDNLEHLFEPMITTTGPRAKAALGLFTSFNIMKKHLGEIHVESEVGKGTDFTVRFPMDLERSVYGRFA